MVKLVVFLQKNKEYMDGNKLIKSPLNYTGGKYKLLPQLLPIILLPPPHKNEINTFVDLFTGGGNVVANVNGIQIQ